MMAMRINLFLTALLFSFVVVTTTGCDAPDQVTAPPKPSLEDRLEALKKSHPAPAVNAAPAPQIVEPQPLITRAVRPPAPKRNDDFEPSGAVVQIFVEEWSPYCKELETFLLQHHVKYIKYDISKDLSAKMYVKQLTGNYSVPVSMVGKTVIQGLDLAALKSAVRKQFPNGDKMKGYRF